MLASPWPLSSDTGSRRRPLFRRVQIALKPASKTLGLHGVFKRGKGRKYLIADSAFKRLQVDDPGSYWLDADEHHLGLALRTGGALDCNEWNDRQAGAQHSLSPVCTENLSRLKSPQQRSDQAEMPVNSAQDCCSYAIEADL
jgi:hypothetical protein